MSKLIAVEGCTLAFRNAAATGVITVDPINTKASSGGNKIYTIISFTVTNYTTTGFTQKDPVKGTITGTAETVTLRGQPVVLVDDESLPIIIKGVTVPTGTDAQVTDSVYVKSAGQNVVKAT